MVEENNLTVQMSALRKAIGPDAIETVAHRGYQFTATPIERGTRPQPTPGNLPAPATCLLGRDAALATLAEQFAKSRLLTLTGAGGIGKSRLALEAALAAAPRYRDGVWLIELASVADSGASATPSPARWASRSSPGRRPWNRSPARWRTATC